MDVGFTGHQHREGVQWSWVERALRFELHKLRDVRKALSSLAAGSDQLFAEAAMRLGIPVVAIIPLEGYERFFDPVALASYHRLLGECEAVQLRWNGDPEQAFFEAGKFIVDHCDLLFAVWDGAPAEGLGGTSDVVNYARNRRPVLHINPVTESVGWI
jgi:hypothetical protein